MQLACEERTLVGAGGLDGCSFSLLDYTYLRMRHENTVTITKNHRDWIDLSLYVTKLVAAYFNLENINDLVALRDQAPNMHKQAMSRDAGRHEVMVQMTSDIELLCSNLEKKKKQWYA